ncbi:uncharacterized protein [Haliotis asinina]|uniref:uncharacterized protein n=1 Tax=Haliotis asinina TaxID=109174 RepID=UPI003531BEDB
MSDISKDAVPTTLYSDYLSATSGTPYVPPTSMSYTPVTLPPHADTQRNVQNTLFGNPGQSFSFSVADYANFRHHLPHFQSSGQVVTHQPQSSEHPRDQDVIEPEQQCQSPEAQSQPSPLPQSNNQPQIKPFPSQTQIHHSIQAWNTFQLTSQSVIHDQPKSDNQSQVKSEPESQVQSAYPSQTQSVQLSQVQSSLSQHKAPQPTRVPQPSHLISPLLAQNHPQLPAGLRNSNYLVQPIIARPSTQRVTEPKDNRETQHFQEKTSESSPSPTDEDNASQTSLQMQLNNLINSTLSGMPQKTEHDGQVPDLTPADHSSTIAYGQAAPQPPIHQTVQQTHSTRLLLHEGESTDSHSEPNTPPPSIQTSESDSSDDDRQSVSDNIPSDSSSGHHPFSSLPNQDPPSHPVNFWEQHVSSAKIASSGLAHPKPVRLSNGYPPMFPPGSLPWVNSTPYNQPFQHPFNSSLMSGFASDPKPQIPQTSTEEKALSESNDKQPPQEESLVPTVKAEPHLQSQSDALSYFLSEFPKSMDGQPNLQHQNMVSRINDQSKQSDSFTPSLPSNVPAQPTPEKRDPVNPSIFSNNIFMSPSFFTQQMPIGNTQLPTFSSSPDSNPSPTCTGKDDSAIDVNSSTDSPSSSIESRSSPELTTSHLPCMEDSNSSLSDTSLMRSRCSSTSSICDTSISSTASSSSSAGAPRNKRPNPDPDMGSYKKKSRTSYTPGQLRALERVYMENPYPECDTIDRLARELDIPDQRLRVWFQNKRARMRRQAKQNKQSTPLPQVNPYSAQPMSALMSAASPYSFLPPNAMMAPGQASQMMPRPIFPYPQGAPGSIMHPGGSLHGAPNQHPTLPQQLTPQQSQVQRLYSFIAHKQQ